MVVSGAVDIEERLPRSYRRRADEAAHGAAEIVLLGHSSHDSFSASFRQGFGLKLLAELRPERPRASGVKAETLDGTYEKKVGSALSTHKESSK